MISSERKAKLDSYKDSWIYDDMKAKLQRRYTKHREDLVSTIDTSDAIGLSVARLMLHEIKVLAQEFDIELT